MKKSVVVSILIAFIVLSIFPLVSADSFDLETAQAQVTRAIDSALIFFYPVLEKIIGDYSGSAFFFSEVLLLILLTIIIKNVLDKTPLGENTKKINIILSIIISILAIRFIAQNNLFEAIFIQYGVLGVAITTILPMAIFFYFVHQTKVGSFGRKVFWTIYGITLLVIWISKANQINAVANWIYILSMIAIGIFIYLDTTIHSYFGFSEFKKFKKHVNDEHITELRRKRKQLVKDVAEDIIDLPTFQKRDKDLEEKIKELLKE